MKPTIQNNYQNIRELIKRNVDTIIILVEQAKGLEEIVSSIKGQTDSELKKRLEGQLDNLRQTISNLVEQTDQLFQSYDEMVESSFK